MDKCDYSLLTTHEQHLTHCQTAEYTTYMQTNRITVVFKYALTKKYIVYRKNAIIVIYFYF